MPRQKISHADNYIFSKKNYELSFEAVKPIRNGDVLIRSLNCLTIHEQEINNIYLGEGIALRYKQSDHLFKFLKSNTIKKILEYHSDVYSSNPGTILEIDFPDIKFIEELSSRIKLDERDILINDNVFLFTLHQLEQMGWKLEKEKGLVDYQLSFKNNKEDIKFSRN